MVQPLVTMCRPLDTFRAREHNFVLVECRAKQYTHSFFVSCLYNFFHCFVIFVVLLLQVSRSHQVRCRSSC